MSDRTTPSPWIDVRDRLPDLKVPVLVALTLSGKRYVTIGRRSERTWRDNHGYDLEYYKGNVVTHWTPLPDLPEREPALAYEANV